MHTVTSNPKHSTFGRNERETMRILSTATSVLGHCIEDNLRGKRELPYYRESISYFNECLSGDNPYSDRFFVTRLYNTLHRYTRVYHGSKANDIFHIMDLRDQLSSYLDHMRRNDEC